MTTPLFRAALLDVWMLLTGVGMWVIARQRGVDWAGYAILAAFLFIAVGAIFLELSLVTLRYIRRMRPTKDPSI